MISPSPAPKKPSRVWLWLVGAAVVWATVFVAAVLIAPSWLRPRIHDALVARLHARTELSVEVGEIELGLDRVSVAEIVLGEPDAPLVRIERVDVDIDRGALWSGKVVVRSIVASEGRVQGDRAALEELARRMLRRRDDERRDDAGRVRLDLDRVAFTDVWVVIDEPEGGPLAHAEARIEGSYDPRRRRAELAVADARLQPERGPPVTIAKLGTELQLVRDEGGSGIAFPVRIDISDLGAPVTPEIAVAGVDGWVQISDASAREIAVELAGGFSDRADAAAQSRLWSVAGSFRRDLSAGVVRLDMAEFELGRIPQVLGRLPVVDSDHATVGGHLALVFGAGVARVEGDVSLAGLNVDHPVLARQPVRDIGFDLQFAAELDPGAHRLRIDHANIDREGIRLSLAADIRHTPERRTRQYRVHAAVPPVDCQAVLEAIPADLIPSLQGFVLDGEFSSDIEFDADYSDLDAMVLAGKVGIDACKVRAVPAHASADRLGGSFSHRVTMRDGRERVVQLYSGSGTFTPLSQISPYMVQAVLTTEDGGFWRHHGFLPSQFKTAMQRNLAAGKVRLGASTITMQMVKNVLLSHERTLSRKLQELFLTWYVETALSKDRIMEIYLNVIEFGPGIYGVTRAARHYFGKYPDELTPPEAAYLALMLPSPVRRHSHYCKGEPSPAMRVKLSRILGIMHDRKRLTDEDYELWKEVPLQFDTSERGDVGACLGEIDRLLEAQQGQRALTGLLAGGPMRADDGASADEGIDATDAAAPPDEPRPRSRPREVDTEDPAEADAPGRPAMDEAPEPAGETW